MKIDKITIDGKKNTLEVTDKIFTNKINKKLISEIMYKNIANFKGRKAKTKQKNEISGSTSKIYAQKGTGNARHASRKAPIFVGGGVAHGPKGENAYKTRKLNKKEKKQGLVSIISEKKNQNKSGSVCEKIQTPGFKKRHYNKLFPTYDVEYIYVLSPWFFSNCEAEIEDAKEIDIPIFNGNDSNCKKDLIKLLCE